MLSEPLLRLYEEDLSLQRVNPEAESGVRGVDQLDADDESRH